MTGRTLAQTALSGLMGFSVAIAASAPKAVDASKLARCAAMAAADERLACYDQLAASTATPASAKESQPSPPTSSAATRPAASRAETAAPAPVEGSHGSFGLAAHPAPDPKAAQSIQAVVTQVSTNQLGSVFVALDNGQSWSVSELNAPLKQGDTITIKKASLGSFLLVTSDRHSYRARRLK